MIKWGIVALLVAGSLGILWTAPWKDEVDTLRATVGSAARVLDDATAGDCARVGTRAGESVRSAVEDLVGGAGRDGQARAAARRQAEQIAACIDRLPRTGAGWRDLERRLRAAAG